MNNSDQYRLAVITMSDKGAAGLREDKSGPVIADRIGSFGKIISQQIISDDRETIENTLIEIVDVMKADLIITTGGTGLAQRDVTPEATAAVADRIVPGISEVIRAESMKKTNRAMLSRGIAATRGNCLIINLPGSPKAVTECMDIIYPVISHALEILTGRSGECARS